MEVLKDATPTHAELFPPPRREHGPSRWLQTIRRDRAELVRFWPVIHNMIVQDLRLRYHRSVLGFLWTLLHPVMMMVTLSVVFSMLLKQKSSDHYAIHLFAGMLPWSFFSASLTECTLCIISNEALIRKIYLPKLVFPIARVLVNLTTFVLSLGALFLLLVPLGARFSPALLFLPVVMLLLAAFTLGLGMIVALAHTFFRDCGHLVAVILQAWYFATPIVYRLDPMIPEEYRWRFWLNPAYPFIRMFQSIIREGAWPELTTVLLAAGIAAISLGVGYAAFKSHEEKLVFRL
jgi:ABC-2 type transport system permease protein/lipopolysaccharide transport system permease protein